MDLLEKMATFVRVVETRNFSVAARQRKVSSAAVSRQVASLEEALGVELVHRTTRRMTVTVEGARYYEHCQRVLREVDEAQAVGRRALAGALRLNAPVSFGAACVAPLMGGLLEKHPHLRVELRLEDRLSDLVLDEVDLAVRVGAPPPDSADLIAHPLDSFHRVVVGAPAYLRRRGVPRKLEALERHDALEHALAGRGVWRFEATEVRVSPVFSCNALSAIHALTVAGRGLAFLPDWFVRDDVAAGRLVHVLPEHASGAVPVFALHRRQLRGEARVQAVLNHLRQGFSARGKTAT